jgi:heptosyltransferase-2
MKDRIILITVQMLGFIMSKLPNSVLEKMTEFFGWVLMTIPNPRRRLLISNLRHAFPNWGYDKIISVASESAARMFEMGFFSLSYPFMSKEQRRRTVYYDQNAETKLNQLRRTGKPVLLLIPHTSLFETLATSPMFRPFGGRSLGAIYRPNKNPAVDDWITRAREKVGIKTFSRKKGLLRARNHLKENNWLAVLYDQNAGVRGAGSYFFGRICSISPLPDLLAKNEGVCCVHAIAKRKSFFSSKLVINEIFSPQQKLCYSAHQYLAKEIQLSERGFPEWLWSHGKWKVNDMSHEIFQLQRKFESLEFIKPNIHATQVFIRMPNWLGDMIMALPIIRAIRKGRPDANIILLCKPKFSKLLKNLNIAERVQALPESRGIKYYYDLKRINLGSCDFMLILTNSLRGDFESLLLYAKVRIGIEVNAFRPLLNFPYRVPNNSNSKHQLDIWFSMIAQHSIIAERKVKDFTAPFSKIENSSNYIIIAPGSVNSPEKRLPLRYWLELSKTLYKNDVNLSFKIIGTSVEDRICQNLNESLLNCGIKSINLCGQTNLTELSSTLKNSNCLVCNDSGAMHLANSLGLPVFAVFGSTSPVKTGPVFDAPKRIFRTESKNFEVYKQAVFEQMKLALESFYLDLKSDMSV